MQYLVAIKMQYNCRYFLCTSIYMYLLEMKLLMAVVVLVVEVKEGSRLDTPV